jgi:hypothetical protein
MAFVDSLSMYLEEAHIRNFNKWKILGNYVWPNYYVGNTWEEEVVWLKNWILTRLAWMDNNMLGNCNPLSERGSEIVSDISVFPSPFRDKVFFKIFTNQTGLIRIRIFSVVGKEIKVLTQMSEPFGESEISWTISPYDDVSVPQGIYLYSIELDDIRIGSGKLVKQ